MEWKLENCYGEVNCMVTTSYQLRFGTNWISHIACRGGCYMIQSLHTLYFAIFCKGCGQWSLEDKFQKRIIL